MGSSKPSSSIARLQELSPRARKELRRDVKAERLRRSFHAFVREFWSVVDPSSFIDDWYTKAICDHLQEVAEGGIRRLLINIPPRHGKSMIVSVLWVAWIWTWRPAWRGVFGSYAHGVALQDSIKSRSCILSSEYQELFVRGKWKLRDDQNRADDFVNTLGGRRVVLSVGGPDAGIGGDCIVFDDPIKSLEAEQSKVKRDECITWWFGSMQSRLNNPATGCYVGIMQRLHEEDLSGAILERQKGLPPDSPDVYQHLCLMSEFESDRRATTYHKPPSRAANDNSPLEFFWQDPRTREGELLSPARFSAAYHALHKTNRGMGLLVHAGQHQQRPAPAEGLMFKKANWRWFRMDRTPPAIRRPDGCAQPDVCPAVVLSPEQLRDLYLSADLAFKGDVTSDPVAIVIAARIGADKYILDVINNQLDFDQTCEELRRLCGVRGVSDPAYPNMHTKLVEDKANGPGVIKHLSGEIPGLIAVNPEGGKEARANVMLPQQKAGNIYLLEGAPWLEEYIGQMANFPRGKHDDMVDATSQLIVYMINSPDLALLRAAYG